MGNESYHLHLCMWKGNWKQPSIYIRKPFLELGWNVCSFVGLLDNFHMTCNVNISDKPKISVILRLESYWFSITISCTNMKERRLNRYNSSLRAFLLLQRHSMAYHWCISFEASDMLQYFSRSFKCLWFC